MFLLRVLKVSLFPAMKLVEIAAGQRTRHRWWLPAQLSPHDARRNTATQPGFLSHGLWVTSHIWDWVKWIQPLMCQNFSLSSRFRPGPNVRWNEKQTRRRWQHWANWQHPNAGCGHPSYVHQIINWIWIRFNLKGNSLYNWSGKPADCCRSADLRRSFDCTNHSFSSWIAFRIL